jgi:hypothetical protein
MLQEEAEQQRGSNPAIPPNAARQFKPFGSVHGSTQGTNSKICRCLCDSKFLASIRINDICCSKKERGGRGGRDFGDGGQQGDGGQGKGAEEQMAKEKCKALDAKSAGTQHRH